jgi:hypothetical protein
MDHALDFVSGVVWTLEIYPALQVNGNMVPIKILRYVFDW